MTESNIILGPVTGLHTGIHDSLYQFPPEGWAYSKRPCQHIFPFSDTKELPVSPSPFTHFHLGEYSNFGGGEEIIHSVICPVLQRRNWVTDISDFAELGLGRVAMNPAIRKELSNTLSDALFMGMRTRIQCMLAAFLHPSCLAVVFFSQGSLDKCLKWLENFGHEDIATHFHEKCRVIHPAQSAVSQETVERKWDDSSTFEIVFCGRSFEGKNGEIALRLFSVLVNRYEEVKLTYIGPIPEGKKRQYSLPAGSVTHFESLEREQVLEVFAKSHLLFHPTSRECFGMVYCEAAAAGMAVVTGYDGGILVHGKEILGDEGALYCDNRKTDSKILEKDMLDNMIHLLDCRRFAREIGMINYQRALTGRISIARRNRNLRAIYERGLERAPKPPLSLGDLPFKGNEHFIAATSQELAVECRKFREKIGFYDLNVYIN